MSANIQLHEPLISSEGQANRLQLLSEALEEMVEGISITCPDSNRFLYVNSAWQRIYGWPAGDVLGQLPRLLNKPGEDESRLRQIVEASREKGWQGQLVNRDREGREFVVHLRTRPLAMAPGNPVGLLGISWPVAAERLRASQWRRLFEERWESLGGQMLRTMESLWAETVMDTNPAPPPSVPALEKLSRRELEVFEMLGRGHSGGDIAALLGVSPNTIQTHRHRIREKLNLPNAKQVAIQAALWITEKGDGRHT